MSDIKSIMADIPMYDNLVESLIKEEELEEQPAYAGSRVDYDVPSLDSIGSGEGHAAHGWGLYYAKNKDVASSYRDKFVPSEGYIITELKINGIDYIEYFGKFGWNKSTLANDIEYDIKLNVCKYVIEQKKRTIKQSMIKVLKAFYEDIDDYISRFAQGEERKRLEENRISIENIINNLSELPDSAFTYKITKGQIHKVELPEDEYLLDEQKPLKEQSDYVKNILYKILSQIDMTKQMSKENLDELLGESIYKTLCVEIGGSTTGGKKAASLFLYKNGIKGITYDGRVDGRCYVIFNPDDVKVVDKLIKESFEDLQGSHSTDVYVSNSVYDMVNKIKSGNLGIHGIRICYDKSKNLFAYGDAYEDTHIDIFLTLCKNGYYPETFTQGNRLKSLSQEGIQYFNYNISQIKVVKGTLYNEGDDGYYSFNSFEVGDYTVYWRSEFAGDDSMDIRGTQFYEILSKDSPTMIGESKITDKTDTQIEVDGQWYHQRVIDNYLGNGTFDKLNIGDDIDLGKQEQPKQQPKYKLNNNFWAWFGNSKVVDKDGNPLVCYHGSEFDIEKFMKDYSGATTGNNYAEVFYFTSSEESAIDYSVEATVRSHESEFYDEDWCNELSYDDYAANIRNKVRENPHINPCFLKMENPFIYDNQHKEFDYMKIYTMEMVLQGRSDEHQLFDEDTYYEMLDALGYYDEDGEFHEDDRQYDGLIIKNVVDDIGDFHGTIDEYIVWNPNQIKSVNNKGNWSLYSDNVNEAFVKSPRSSTPIQYYTKSDSELEQIIDNKFNDVPVRVVYDFQKELYIFGNANNIIHTELLNNMAFYSNVSGYPSNNLGAQDYLHKHCASFKIIHTNDFKSFSRRDGYRYAYIGKIKDDWYVILRDSSYEIEAGYDVPDQLKRCSKVPLLKNVKFVHYDVRDFVNDENNPQKLVDESIENKEIIDERLFPEIPDDKYADLLKDTSSNGKANAYTKFFGQYLINNHLHKDEDIAQLTQRHQKLQKAGLVKPIMDYRNIFELIYDLQDHNDYETKSEKSKDVSKGAIKLATIDGYTIYNIVSREAAQKYGKNTKWCTTNKSDDFYYKKYTTDIKDDGRLIERKLFYIIGNNQKYGVSYIHQIVDGKVKNTYSFAEKTLTVFGSEDDFIYEYYIHQYENDEVEIKEGGSKGKIAGAIDWLMNEYKINPETIEKEVKSLISEQVAYHGTLHNHDKFSTDKIGTGNTGQTHGWGLYFTSSKKEAEDYKNRALKYTALYNGQPITEKGAHFYVGDTDVDNLPDSSDLWKLLSRVTSDGKSYTNGIKWQLKYAKERIESGELSKGDLEYYTDLIKSLNKQLKLAKNLSFDTGMVYRVELPDDEFLLNEDEHMSGQSPYVYKAIMKLYQDGYLKKSDLKEIGGRIYTAIAYKLVKNIYDDKAYRLASEKLHEYGIKGTLSFDIFNGKQTKVFCIFSENDVKILDKNSEAKMLEQLDETNNSETIFYHGSPSKNIKEWYTNNIFWSTDREFAETYGRYIYSAKLDLGNTFNILNKQHFDWLLTQNNGVISIPDENSDDDQDFEVCDYTNFMKWEDIEFDNWECVEQYLDIIKTKFDSAVVFEQGTENYVIFSNNQIHLINDKPDIRRIDETIYYHYSNNKFDSFQSGNSAGTIYFSADKNGAKKAARGKKYEYKANLDIKNPVNTPETPINWYEAEDSIKVAKWKREGYDSVYVKDEAGISVAVFDNSQIHLIKESIEHNITLYHASDSKFDNFDINYVNTKAHKEQMKGIWLSNSRKYIKQFGKIIYTCKVDNSNILNIDSDKYDKIINQFEKKYNIPFDLEGDNANKAQKYLIDNGYTGIYFEKEKGVYVYVIFDTSIIKIIGNKQLSETVSYDNINWQEVVDTYIKFRLESTGHIEPDDAGYIADGVKDYKPEVIQQALKETGTDNLEDWAWKVNDYSKDFGNASRELLNYYILNLAKTEYNYILKSFNDNYNVYRAINSDKELNGFVEDLKEYGTGNCWGKSLYYARDYYNDEGIYSTKGKKYNYILKGEITNDNIDWTKTIALNMEDETEGEIRLKVNAPIHISQIILGNEQKNVNLDLNTGSKYGYDHYQRYDNLNESIYHATMLKDGTMFEVHQNPTKKEFWELLNRSEMKELRGVLGINEPILYVWDSYYGTHKQVFDSIIGKDWKEEDYVGCWFRKDDMGVFGFSKFTSDIKEKYYGKKPDKPMSKDKLDKIIADDDLGLLDEDYKYFDNKHEILINPSSSNEIRNFIRGSDIPFRVLYNKITDKIAIWSGYGPLHNEVASRYKFGDRQDRMMLFITKGKLSLFEYPNDPELIGDILYYNKKNPKIYPSYEDYLKLAKSIDSNQFIKSLFPNCSIENDLITAKKEYDTDPEKYNQWYSNLTEEIVSAESNYGELYMVIYKNPTRKELSEDKYQQFRIVEDIEGNLYFANAHDFIHIEIENRLEKANVGYYSGDDYGVGMDVLLYDNETNTFIYRTELDSFKDETLAEVKEEYGHRIKVKLGNSFKNYKFCLSPLEEPWLDYNKAYFGK